MKKLAGRPTESLGEGLTVCTGEFSAEELVPVIREVLEAGGAFTLKVTGYSMTPTLKHLRDQVQLVSPAVRPARTGEIVFFEREGGVFVLHRIIGVLPEGRLLINGDAQNWTESILPEQIIGVVNRMERRGRWISCDRPFYRMWVKVWGTLRPLRPFLLRKRRNR